MFTELQGSNPCPVLHSQRAAAGVRDHELALGLSLPAPLLTNVLPVHELRVEGRGFRVEGRVEG